MQIFYFFIALGFGAALYCSWFGSPVAETHSAEYRLLYASNPDEAEPLYDLTTIGGKGCGITLPVDDLRKHSPVAIITIDSRHGPAVSGSSAYLTVYRKGAEVSRSPNGKILLASGDRLVLTVQGQTVHFILERSD